jgi:glycosyltransferase involved in cell wall biosynthesis
VQQFRIALIAGTLGKGGAEKQLVYIARTLKSLGVDVRVFSLTKGEFYEAPLRDAQIPVIWIGRYQWVPIRLLVFAFHAMHFHPHYIQACHPFVNLYAVIAARLSGAMDIGAVRSNVEYELQGNRFWGKWLLKLPRWILTNSYHAKEKLIKFRQNDKILTLPNVIDVSEFDQRCELLSEEGFLRQDGINLVIVAHLDRAKRIERFLEIMAALDTAAPQARGYIIGDGPERENLEKMACQLGLTDGNICFLGSRDDVPGILSHCDAFVLTSDIEGFPNVLLEAMAARLPIVTTPAGDSARVVVDGVTGFVVDFDDIPGFVKHILSLSNSSALRRELGEAGRLRVENLYSVEGLSGQLLSIYREISPHVFQ